jgi:hypothetical protein
MKWKSILTIIEYKLRSRWFFFYFRRLMYFVRAWKHTPHINDDSNKNKMGINENFLVIMEFTWFENHFFFVYRDEKFIRSNVFANNFKNIRTEAARVNKWKRLYLSKRGKNTKYWKHSLLMLYIFPFSHLYTLKH